MGCCGVIHDGLRPARTAEALMRSRYSAFALRLSDYLLTSWHPDTRPMAMHFEPGQQWLGLRIVDTSEGGPGDAAGTVTFEARYRTGGGRERTMTERSRFQRYAGAWVYVDGEFSD